MPCYRNADHKNVHVFEDWADLCQCEAATTIHKESRSAASLTKIETFTLAAVPVVASIYTRENIEFHLDKVAKHSVSLAKATIAELEKEMKE